MASPSGDTARRIERVLALGHTEAKRRRHPWGQLDALMEATVAVCDLFPPNGQSDDWYLSAVDLTSNGQEQPIASSLADFDQDLRDSLPQGDPLRLTGEVSLRIPLHAADATEVLSAFWQESGLCPSGVLTRPSYDPPSNPADCEELTGLFHRSLRHAFDAIADQDDGVFTLSIDWPATMDGVTPFYTSVPIGYCLAATVLYRKIQEGLDASRIPQLEQPLAYRSQSHTNVSTRLASLVRSERKRSGHLAQRTPPDVGIQTKIREVGELEALVWRREDKTQSPPPDIFMMPLCDYDFRLPNEPVRAIGHSYFRLSDPNENPDARLHRRYRDQAFFSTVLLREYYDVVAREIARGLSVDGDVTTLVGGINARLKTIDWLYSMSSKIELQEGSPAGSLLDELKKLTALDLTATRTSRTTEWQHVFGNRLSSVKLVIAPGHTHRRLDVLLSLMRHFDRQVARTTYEVKLQTELKRLERQAADLVGEIHNIQDMTAIDDADRVWLRLRTIAPLFAPGVVHDSKSFQRIDGITFTIGHDVCAIPDCGRCEHETIQRIEYVFGRDFLPAHVPHTPEAPCTWNPDDWPPQTDAKRYTQPTPQTLYEYAKRLVSASTADQGNGAMSTSEALSTERRAMYFLVKRAVDGTLTPPMPKLAGVVTMFTFFGAIVDETGLGEDQLATTLTGAPSSWPIVVRGLAALSEPDSKHAGEHGRAKLQLVLDGGVLVVTLRSLEHKYSEWFAKTKSELPAKGAVQDTISKTRRVDVARALGKRVYEDPAEVSIEPSNGDLVCRWSAPITDGEPPSARRTT